MLSITKLIEFATDFVIIFFAVVVADLAILWFKDFRERRLDLGCDYCEEVRALYRTPDKRFYLCKTCMNAFLAENSDKFSQDDIVKLKRRYK